MRITYVLGWSRLERKACQEQTVSTAAALARAGAEVTLLMPHAPSDPEIGAEELRAYHHVEGEFNVVRRPFLWPDTGVVPSYLWLRRAMADPAATASHLVLTRIPVVIASDVGRRNRFVFDHYRPWPDRLPMLKPRFRRTLGHDSCLGVVAHSDYAAESYRRLPIPDGKLLVAHNGFDLKTMTPVLSKSQARQRLNLPADRPIAVYAGRMARRKGLEQILLTADQCPDVLFLLVGSEGNGVIEKAALSRPNVRLEPWQAPDALAPYLYAADVLLIPSSLEPMQRFGTTVLPLKTFKYLAAGRPILAPRAADTAELLHDEHNALLIPPDQPAAAAAALARLLAEPEFAARLSSNALSTAQERTWEFRARRLLDFFEQRLSVGLSGQAARVDESPRAGRKATALAPA